MTQTLTTERLREIASSPSFTANPLSHEVKYMARELLANREALPVELHMGVAMEVFDTLRDAMLSSRVEHSELGAMGATKIEVWSSKIGALLEMHHGNGGCTLKVCTAPPAPVVNTEFTGAPAVPDFKKLARELVENLVDCGGVDDSSIKQYLKWTEKTCRSAMLAQPVSQRYKLPEGFKLMPIEMTDEIAEAIAMEARCCGGIALCIYEAALAAAPEVGN